MHLDGTAYPLDWTSPPSGTITKEDMPSLDYALYLMNTVKFHVSQLYHLFDEEIFLQGLYAFYDSSSQAELVQMRLWYCQYLLIIALGKAFLVRKNYSEENPPGAEFFVRAMKLLPDVTELYQDALLSIEILCAISLCLQSFDHRNSAYTYIGIALRISLTQGLHHDCEMERENPKLCARRQSIWWTLYILDRRFSALMGAPVSIHDEDITLDLPNPDHAMQKCGALSIHVRLSRLMSILLSTIYGPDGRLDSSFTSCVQEVLRRLAHLAPELEKSYTINMSNSQPLSRVSATLNLYYHQCVVLATRPVLMNFLFYEPQNRLTTHGGGDPRTALIKACADSAIKSITILLKLQKGDLLQPFLPFDLECVYSCALVLTLISAMHSHLFNTEGNLQPNIDMSQTLLNTMVQAGSVTARHRLSELNTLRELTFLLKHQQSEALDPMLAPVPSRGDVMTMLQSPAAYELCVPANAVGAVDLAPDEILEMAQLFEWDNMFPEAREGITPEFALIGSGAGS